ELFNLAMITGKLGKTANGLISLKEKNNAQGIFDMGICPTLGVGAVGIKDKDLVARMKKVWKVKSLPKEVNESQFERLEKGKLKNVFIFGEDPLGCTDDKVKVAGWLTVADFVVVSDYFMTDTAMQADLVLPASFPIESGGTFTNTQKVIQGFEPAFKRGAELSSLEQLAALMKHLDIKQKGNPEAVMSEIVKLLPAGDKEEKFVFRNTDGTNTYRLFSHGCDYIVKRFDEEFDKEFDH
ncbi:MAG: molybdopterin-dependent oxidoreductase, partial [Bacteroidota bacterium]